jgi:hypothetical protein
MPMVRLLQLVMPVREAEELFTPTIKVSLRRSQPLSCQVLNPAFRGQVIQPGTTSHSTGIGRFFEKSRAQCISCRVTLPTSQAGRRSLCGDCRQPERSLPPLLTARDAATVDFAKATTHCQGCQKGSRHLEVICENEACPVYYRRARAARLLAEVDGKVKAVERALAAEVNG